MSDQPDEDLERFINAQASSYERARRELSAGRKRGHWIWYIFPQLDGLGRSRTSKRYALASVDEARAYLAHPVLGPRLKELTAVVNAIDGRTVNEIFGYPDDLKFRSSMTLFSLAAPDEPVFQAALSKYFDGKPDPLTLQLLGRVE
jgi:uncharacterized protein (DUF1810 family)